MKYIRQMNVNIENFNYSSYLSNVGYKILGRCMFRKINCFIYAKRKRKSVLRYFKVLVNEPSGNIL